MRGYVVVSPVGFIDRDLERSAMLEEVRLCELGDRNDLLACFDRHPKTNEVSFQTVRFAANGRTLECP